MLVWKWSLVNLEKMSHNDALQYVEKMIGKIDAYLIHNDDGLISAMTETNADGWEFDEHTNLEAWFEGKGKVGFSFNATFSGDQMPDRAFCGTIIKASIRGKLADENDEWRIVECKSSGAKITNF
jgi:hypothetical protein